MSIFDAIAVHKAAWRAFQSASPADASHAEDREAETLIALLCTAVGSIDDAQALLAHLVWYQAEEGKQAGAQVTAFLSVLQWLPALAKARALLDAVDFDNNGIVVAGHMQGGNGGLVSRDTTKAADELRRALDGVLQ